MAAMEPEDLFAPIDHDLRVCGLRPRLVFTAPPGEDPQQWRDLVVSGARLGPLEFEPELAADPGAAVKSLAFHTQAAVLENLQLIEGGRAWPVCRGKHRHPMALVSESEGGWPHWKCPVDASYHCAVGEHPGVTGAA
ncbi:hypothetical protein ACIQU1_22975 [Streptomyces angustmyceticus]|uniref:hypothetical protein n=1 Tax=Streptomyces angustmyceticus TaxID=285578 RepID=UPI00344E5BA4